MVLNNYYSYLSRDLKNKSEHLTSGFSSHRPSIGENREQIVKEFLIEHLPSAFGVDTGLIHSNEGEFSNQADLVLYDKIHNSPLYPTKANKLFLVESVYAMIEVKTHIDKSAIKDSIDKCIRFKNLERNYSDIPSYPRITDSLFVLWGFEGDSNQTIKKNTLELVGDLPVEEQPDFIIIPNRILISMGSYRKLTMYGMKGSNYREKLEKQYPNKNMKNYFIHTRLET